MIFKPPRPVAGKRPTSVRQTRCRPDQSVTFQERIDNGYSDQKCTSPADEARATFAQFESIETVAEWLLRVVEDWSHTDVKAESIAFAGSAWSGGGDKPDPVTSALFDVIADQVGNTANLHFMLAGIERLKQLAKAQRVASHE